MKAYDLAQQKKKEVDVLVAKLTDELERDAAIYEDGLVRPSRW